MRRPLAILALAAVVVAAASAILASTASADHTQFSIFQDDQYLLYEKPAIVARTLSRLKSLGVQEVRVTVKWSTIAPAPTSRIEPTYNFAAYNPSSYPQANWAPYDRVVEDASKDGLKVLFTVTGPGPLWATQARPAPPSAAAATHWYLNAGDFEQFVFAVGYRYSGRYFNLPAVTNWSVWNEPDQPGWLAPQTMTIGGKNVAVAPKLYREYVDAAWKGLSLAGHTVPTNTILIGETAPEGGTTAGAYEPEAPMPFLRDVYCVGNSYRPLSGTAASNLGCPTTAAARAQFASAHPGLFQATGFAHHPYYFTKAPSFSAPERNWVPIANISRLESGLDRSLKAWGSHRKLPIYYTEYGYQTKPPDPYQVVTTAEQAEYLNQADYIAYNQPRVKSVAQFELFDSAPDPAYKKGQFGYWDTFQTGLLFANGKPKPAYAAYETPLWVKSANFHRGTAISVWGQIRPYSSGGKVTAKIQYRGSSGGWSTLRSVTTQHEEGYFTTRVSPPGSGSVRVAWYHGKTLVTSRPAAIIAS